jgi:hypothetical protein
MIGVFCAAVTIATLGLSEMLAKRKSKIVKRSKINRQD